MKGKKRIKLNTGLEINIHGIAFKINFLEFIA